MEQEDIFRIMFEHATIGIILSNSQGVIVKANTFACKLFGYQETELEGQKIEILVPDSIKKRHIKHRNHYHDKPTRREMGAGLNLYAKRKDGSTFPVAISLGHTLVGGKQLVISYVNNITEQREFEAKIRQEKETAQTYLDIAGSMVIVVDQEANIQLLNQKGEELLGIKEEVVTGLNWFDNFLPEEEQANIRNIFNSLMAKQGENVAYYENFILNKKGEKRLIWFHNRVLMDKLGEAIGIIISGVDITEQRQAEQLLKESQLKLENYAAALESKVKERTMKLEESQQKLMTALSKEKELGELKSRFVTMASHEFRTPLSMILSSAELIEMYLEKKKYDKFKRNVNRIKSSVRNLTTILNDFLSIEKLETGKISVQKTTVSLVSFLDELQEEIQPILKKNQRFLIEAETSETIKTDPTLLKNILLNLISNAIKYSPNSESVQLKISKEDHSIRFAVIDQGVGIPELEKSHMFTRFFRASNVENIQGTGLGLTIVKRYLDLLGGHIDFESKEGVGSTFYIWL